MREVKYCLAASLDGFVARPDGGVDWLFTDGDYGLAAFFDTIDTVIMGRRTHDKAIELGMPRYEGVDNYVFSRTKDAGERNGVVYTREAPAELVARLRQRPGKDLWLVGGGDLARDFFQAGLVDRVIVAVHPRLLGEGIPVVEPGVEAALELAAHHIYEDGLVSLEYRVLKAGSE